MATITPIQAFSLGADALYLSKRPLPVAPDGHYDWENQANADESPQEHSGVTNLINTMENIASKGAITPDPKIVGAFLDTVLHPGAIDDRKGAFPAGLTLLSRMPPGSDVAKNMSNSAIALLYNTLPPCSFFFFRFLQIHSDAKPQPRASLLGPVHSFREADGGGNNLQIPQLGRAGTPYARSVQGKWCYSSTSLPDPGLIFDTLMKARDRKDHPGGNSSLTFAFATLVIHSLFRSDLTDWNVNATSSYLDLSPLYGINQATQDLVRNKGEGRGVLYPDSFSEERLVFLPPAASALLVILNRNHNYVADMLLKINERGRWTDPPPTDEKLRAQQDEEIFQTAKLVNCGHFMGLIMSDYVAGFLGWGLTYVLGVDIDDDIFMVDFRRATHGTWTLLIPLKSTAKRWNAVKVTIAAWNSMFCTGGTQHSPPPIKNGPKTFSLTFSVTSPFDQLTVQDFGAAFAKLFATIDPHPNNRTFGGLTRGPDGKFSDDDLAKILLDATESPAGAYRARGTPTVLRVIEIMGILQARQWGVCTMNEFRQFLGLKQFNDFEEWNSDPAIANAARRLYGHIDNLELYTGLQCEDTIPLSPGLRFASGYTMMRAVLGDAISLVRGDRFYTTDYTAANLTAWGYQDCVRDPQNGGFGGNLPKLLMRHLPRHYPYNSVYGCFPFFTPQKMKDSLTKQGIAANYTFQRPVPTPQPKVLNTFTGINYVFNDPLRFPTVYDMKGLGNGYGFMLCFDQAIKHDPDRALALHALFPTEASLSQYRAWYRDQVTQLIKERSWKYDGVPGNYVEVVRNVINVTSVRWAADRLCGLPMKTKDHPSGLYTEQEVYDMFSTSRTFALFFDPCRAHTHDRLTFLSIGDNEHGFSLRWAAIQSGGVIQALIAKAILEIAPQSAPNAVLGFISKCSQFLWPQSSKPCYPFLSKLSETGRPLDALVATVVGLAVGSSVNYAQAAVHVIDFYLDDARAQERAQIMNLVQGDDTKSTDLLRGYVREAMRLNPQFTGLWRDVAADASIPQGKGLPPMNVKAGDRIWASFRNAHINPTDFPDPLTVDPTRPPASYNLNGAGFHTCPGVSYAEQTIAEIVKVVFKLKNVRRAAGDAGRLAGFRMKVNETETNVYLTPYGTTSPWPGEMMLVYDD
ncbi:Heme peroxidase [Mycena sanguinolenta]|uniref:Heme peroxidase n=1 Tax=Mycena sanguinolenta TaxID=230812 RepID=A0A8H6YHB4_9AGAR|nr:Heme peroxidase [Mycena sanguinolenta]